MRADAIALIALVVSLGVAAAPGFVQMPEDISPGVYAELEGVEAEGGAIVALEVELRHAPGSTDQVQGTIASVDVARRRVTIAGIPVVLPGDARMLGSAGEPVAFASLEAGVRVDARGHFGDGILRAQSLELRSGSGARRGEVGLEGRVSRVDRTSGTFRMLGATVRVTPDTSVELD